jgi:hypothetical protein
MLKNNIFKNPSLKNVMMLSLLWFISNMLLVLSITDLFSDSFLQKRYLIVYFVMIASTTSIIRIYHNYFKNN